MNTFFNYIQPTIIRASNDPEVPEHLRCRYFINFNIFGIDYFEDHYILSENSNNFQYLLLKENSGMFMLEDSIESENIIDIPRIYIDITDDFVNDNTNMFKSFVYQASINNAIWGQGIDNFLAGHQYYLNNTLYSYLAVTNQLTNVDFSIRLNNYLDETGHMTKYWMDLSNDPYKDYADLEYFNEKNKLLTSTFSEEELNNFYSTFANTILKYTKILPETLNTENNQVYNVVLNYFANFMNDAGSNAIAMVLNKLYTNSTQQKCGCNSAFSKEGTTYSEKTCYELYKDAMNEWLKKMLSDKTFYEDWFRISLGRGRYLVNEILIEKLKTLIDEFKELQNMLAFTKKKVTLNCECPTVTFDESYCNYGILNNYYELLGYVKEDTMDANKNKLKIYGSAFAELLPKMQF